MFAGGLQLEVTDVEVCLVTLLALILLLLAASLLLGFSPAGMDVFPRAEDVGVVVGFNGSFGELVCLEADEAEGFLVSRVQL